jgi:hypothetical protein
MKEKFVFNFCYIRESRTHDEAMCLKKKIIKVKEKKHSCTHTCINIDEFQIANAFISWDVSNKFSLCVCNVCFMQNKSIE